MKRRRKRAQPQWKRLRYSLFAVVVLASALIVFHLTSVTPSTQVAAAAASSQTCEQTYQACLKGSTSASQCENQWYECITAKCTVGKSQLSSATSCPSDPECEQDCQQVVSDTKGILNCCLNPSHQGQACRVKVYHQDGSAPTCNPSPESVPTNLNGAGTPEGALIPGFHDVVPAVSNAYNGLAPSLQMTTPMGPLPYGTQMDDSGNIYLPPGYTAPQSGPGGVINPTNGQVESASEEQVSYTSPLSNNETTISTVIPDQNNGVASGLENNNPSQSSNNSFPSTNFNSQSAFISQSSQNDSTSNSCPLRIFIWCI
jgi:hypothetical protein